MLLTKTLNKIDQIQKNFLWGTTDQKRKLHLVNWDLVTRTKGEGGLGLRKDRSKNLTLLASLAWRLANNPTNLWEITLLQKYSHKPSEKGSFIWKNIIKG